MSVDCSSVIAYGHILTEAEYYFLEEKLGDCLWEKLDEYNKDYSFYLICRNNYTDKKHQNYMLGVEVIYISDGSFAPIGVDIEDKKMEKEIQEEIKELLGESVECGYYAFLKWW